MKKGWPQPPYPEYWQDIRDHEAVIFRRTRDAGEAHWSYITAQETWAAEAAEAVPFDEDRPMDTIAYSGIRRAFSIATTRSEATLTYFPLSGVGRGSFPSRQYAMSLQPGRERLEVFLLHGQVAWDGVREGSIEIARQKYSARRMESTTAPNAQDYLHVLSEMKRGASGAFTRKPNQALE